MVLGMVEEMPFYRADALRYALTKGPSPFNLTGFCKRVKTIPSFLTTK